VIRGSLFVLVVFTTVNCFAQTDWLFYTRTVRDVHGNLRFDQNVVPTITLNKLLRLELGLRHGETTHVFDAYYHYKVELQSRYFWRTVRIVTRLSDNIIKSPDIFSKSNYLAIAETRVRLSSRFVGLFGVGGVVSFQRDGIKDAVPSLHGGKKVYPTYRASLRYLLTNDWFVSGVIGAYDTFNPYLPESPFLQIDTEYDLSNKIALYAYFRYQYERHIDVGLNDFLGLGIRFGNRQ
jgi:hypothetical protein